jgi:GMP synthase (glutamine-hydrolysing)
LPAAEALATQLGVGREITIVKTGSTYPSVSAQHGDFEQWIARGLGLDRDGVEVIDVVAGATLPEASAPRAVVVTGSAAMVTDRADWSERTAGWLADAVAHGVPILGICYGHQLLAHALGGEVALNPRGRQIGTVDVTLTAEALADPLLSVLRPVSHVPVSHLQSVVRLPASARLLASSPRDPHHAFAVGERAWGVQFHPEFNAAIARAYIREREAAIQQEGLDPVALSESATDTDDGERLLRRFEALTR